LQNNFVSQRGGSVSELKTKREYQERFLDGYDRSQLRQAVQRVKPKRLSGLKRKYAGMLLGASLALGGLGIPLSRASHSLERSQPDVAEQTADRTAGLPDVLKSDLDTAQSIAREVTGGVQQAANVATSSVSAIAETAGSAAVAVAKTVAKPAESVKQAFFRKEVPFGSLIYDEAKKNDLPPELVAAVVHTESKFVPTARSQQGALGLMQLVPKTARWMGATNPMNPAQNVAAGARYLKYLSGRFNGNTEKMIAAYNAGEGNVRRFNGVPPFRETRNYVQRVRSFQQDLGDRVAGQVAELDAITPAVR
jgi:soluble lytic murein transglycosylase-like protein